MMPASRRMASMTEQALTDEVLERHAMRLRTSGCGR